MFFDDLSQAIAQCLKPNGKAWLLLPQGEHNRFTRFANEQGLYLQKQIDIIPRDNQASKLGIWVYGLKSSHSIKQSSVTVYQADNNEYTQDFKGYLHDFYLKL